jgi:D-alanyl-D-alanine carboxypeptidase (penicillin-binding protein 5/6)
MPASPHARSDSRGATVRAGALLAGALAVGMAIVLGISFAAPTAPQAPVKKDEFQTPAPLAFLMDADTGTILFEKNADQLMAPSNMAKLMTLEIVFHEIKLGHIRLDTEYEISEYAWRHGGGPAHTSSMFAPLHSRVRVQDLVYSAIIQSGNDACIALAEGIAGSEAKFAVMMTKRARELGLTKSYFSNATGLPEPTLVMTPREIARLAQHIIKTYPEFYPIFAQKDFTWNKIHQPNANPLLGMDIGADGLKIGFTEDGGYGLVGSAVQNNLRLIAVINGLKGAPERAAEGRKLIEWGFRGVDRRSLFADGQVIGEARLYGGAQWSVPLVAQGAVSLLVPRGSTDRVLARIVYTGPVRAPVQQGQRIGVLRVWRGDNVVLEVPLQAGESVERGGLPRRALDAATEFVIGLFISGPKRI